MRSERTAERNKVKTMAEDTGQRCSLFFSEKMYATEVNSLRKGRLRRKTTEIPMKQCRFAEAGQASVEQKERIVRKL